MAERRACLIRVRPGIARYDGHSEWHDETFPRFHHEDEEAWLRACLGSGRGAVCLDVACGTGRVREFVPDGAVLPWDLALLTEKPG